MTSLRDRAQAVLSTDAGSSLPENSRWFAHAVIRDLLAENARLQSAVESLQTLDKWVNNWLAQINRDIDDLERADIADDMASDWFGSGWGASYRDEITALTEGDTDD